MHVPDFAEQPDFIPWDEVEAFLRKNLESK